MESMLGVKKTYCPCPKAEKENIDDMKISKIRNKCLCCDLIGARLNASTRKDMRILRENEDFGQNITLRRVKFCGWSGKDVSSHSRIGM